MNELPRFPRSSSPSSLPDVPTADRQTSSSGNPGSRTSSPPKIGPSVNQQFSDVPHRQNNSGLNTLAPQKPSPFGNLPSELRMAVVKASKGKSRLNLALADRDTNSAAQTALTAEQAMRKIKDIPINSIGDLNEAWGIAKNSNLNFRDELIQSIAEKLIYLSREDLQAGKEFFMQEVAPFINEGNKIDQAIDFFDWYRSAAPMDGPNSSEDSILEYKKTITQGMRQGDTAREAVEGLKRDGLDNNYAMDLCVQYARGLEVNGLQNLKDHVISQYQELIEKRMRSGLSAKQAVERVMTKNRQVNDYDMNLLTQRAENFRP